MATYEQLKAFWNDWGNHDPEFYKVFVGVTITPEQYEDITGQPYVPDKVS